MSDVLERVQVCLRGSAQGKGRPLFLLLDLLATLRNVLWTFNNIGCRHRSKLREGESFVLPFYRYGPISFSEHP